jgi:hypothetical protein
LFWFEKEIIIEVKERQAFKEAVWMGKEERKGRPDRIKIKMATIILERGIV